jgi:hypothetical protein
MVSGAVALSAFYGLVVAILAILLLSVLVALVAWAATRAGGCDSNKGSSCCAPACPVWVRNPRPDDRVFMLARVDGSSTGGNGCATGSFTVQRQSNNQLLYTVTTPPDTFITDIYTLEVRCPGDFPLTPDGCAVDLSAFHHQRYDCATTSNVQLFNSTISAVHTCRCLDISVLVVFSDSDTCDPLQMMTIAGPGAKPIPLTGDCTTPICPPDSCCDPIVPSFVHAKLPRCRPSDPPQPSSPSSPIISDAPDHANATAAPSAQLTAPTLQPVSVPPAPPSLASALPSQLSAAAAVASVADVTRSASASVASTPAARIATTPPGGAGPGATTATHNATANAA